MLPNDMDQSVSPDCKDKHLNLLTHWMAIFKFIERYFCIAQAQTRQVIGWHCLP
jgi:hypothetical protein